MPQHADPTPTSLATSSAGPVTADAKAPAVRVRCEGVVTALVVFPVKGEPGRELRQATLGESGMLGDRTKRHALLVVTTGEAAGTDDRGLPVRANVVVDLAADDLAAGQGRELRVGDAVVRLDRKPSGCPGMYAEVVVPGEVLLGDVARVEG